MFYIPLLQNVMFFSIFKDLSFSMDIFMVPAIGFSLKIIKTYSFTDLCLVLKLLFFYTYKRRYANVVPWIKILVGFVSYHYSALVQKI